jgi:hypothetical protein
MNNVLPIFLLICCLFSCRKKDTYPDYGYIVGKQKLVYIKKGNLSWPWDSTVKIFPSDKYEIEFRKESKVRLIKNSKKEQTLKVYSCNYYDYTQFSHLTNIYYRYGYYSMNIDRKSYDFNAVVNGHTGNQTDTFSVLNFYPFDLTDTLNGNYYSCYYVKE